MIYVFITIVIMVVAAVLWSIVCFHYVLQHQRRLNALWQQMENLFLQRDEQIGEMQNLWLSANVQPPANIKRLQDLLAQDVASDGYDVRKRAELRQAIEIESQNLLTAARSTPGVAQQPDLPFIEQFLRDNGVILTKAAKDYNRTVQVYNALLQRQPNRFIAQKLGLVAAPYYVAN